MTPSTGNPDDSKFAPRNPVTPPGPTPTAPSSPLDPEDPADAMARSSFTPRDRKRALKDSTVSNSGGGCLFRVLILAIIAALIGLWWLRDWPGTTWVRQTFLNDSTAVADTTGVQRDTVPQVSAADIASWRARADSLPEIKRQRDSIQLHSDSVSRILADSARRVASARTARAQATPQNPTRTQRASGSRRPSSNPRVRRDPCKDYNRPGSMSECAEHWKTYTRP